MGVMLRSQKISSVKHTSMWNKFFLLQIRI